jgi:hypothetical protein
MANATSLTVTPLTANAATADPTPSNFDTGTAAVTVKTSALTKTDRFFMRVANTAAATLTVTVNAGTDPPDFRAGVGAVSGAAIAITTGVQWLGPFESSRFSQSDQTLSVTFTPTSGTITCTAQCFTLPLV